MKQTLLILIYIIISGNFVFAQGNKTFKLMLGLLNTDKNIQSSSAKALADSGDINTAAALIDALYFKDVPDDLVEALERLTSKNFGKRWPAWMEWYGKQDIKNTLEYQNFKRVLFSKIDPFFSGFLNPGFPTKIRWDEIIWGGVKKDGIPSLDNPIMISASSADYLDDNDDVFGLTVNGVSHAYPLKIFNWHEMINIVIDDNPVSISYCTLCGTAIPYDTKWQDRTFSFGSSGLLYRSNKLMYDRQTNTLWSSIQGKPVAGLLAGEDIELKQYPIVRTSWKEWKAANPATLVLDENTGYSRDYSEDGAYSQYFKSRNTMFPIAWRDNRMAAKEWIYGIHANGQSKAYPVKLFEEREILHDTLNGSRYVLLGNLENLAIRVYRNKNYVFEQEDSEYLIDDQNRLWEINEQHLKLKDGSETLPRYPGHLSYWFAWYSFFPETELAKKKAR